jgi:hypothetical protein
MLSGPASLMRVEGRISVGRYSLLLMCAFLTTVLAVLTFVGVTYRSVLDPRSIAADSKCAYSIALHSWPFFVLESDGPSDAQRSTLDLFEDGQLIGPSHALHDVIREQGRGAYSHWERMLLFSSSDGSDPRNNGRQYVVASRQRLESALPFLIVSALTSVLFARLLPSTSFWRRRDSGYMEQWHYRAPGMAVVFAYVSVFIATWLCVSFYYGERQMARVVPAAGARYGVIERSAFYRLHAKQFDLVFLGDSRTYCGIHPELIDPKLGTRSINLAQFANWLPTQYALVRDLVSSIPSGTTVVWSIGHQNFYSSTGIQRVYPIDWQTALKYVFWRVPLTGLFDNVAYFNPLLRLWADRAEIRRNWYDALHAAADLKSLQLIGDAKAAQFEPAVVTNGQSSQEAAAAITRQYAHDRNVQETSAISDNGRVNSVVLYLMGGGYYRIELAPDYFRQKQRELAPSAISDADAAITSLPEPDPGLLRLLDEILELFRQNNVEVIVNELEEAPFRYPNQIIREKWRKLMHDIVQKKVESKGFLYITTNLDEIKDDDYFDYNHMNSRGGTKYALLLSRRLRQLLRK